MAVYTYVTTSANAASETSSARSRTPKRLYVYDTLLERFSPDLEHMALELGPLIQQQEALVRQGHRTWHGPLPP
jgi:hypothetical protein